MPLVIEQIFPLGRFHATRWNQNPFEDRYGEWPPSPWRFLRALSARWFQYSRETGDCNDQVRDKLLRTLAVSPPTFHLPNLTRNGIPLRQYQPTEVAWTDASAKAAAYKKPRRTLALDNYRVMFRTRLHNSSGINQQRKAVYWIFDFVSLQGSEKDLLNELLRRVLYFGRAESFSFLRIIEPDLEELISNCDLHSTENGDRPVLVADPTTELDIKHLLASTDDRLLAGKRIPPGSVWHYARIQDHAPVMVKQCTKTSPLYSGLNLIQFAVGGRVFPPPERWIKITERFRGETLSRLVSQLTGNSQSRYSMLSRTEQERLRLLSGKDADGEPLEGHQHPYFVLWPDEHGHPTRLVCWRQTPFSPSEVKALLSASERMYSWEFGNPDWWIRLVPLPFETPLPGNSMAELPNAASWISVTPFVLPDGRHRFRGKGRERRGETPEAVLKKMITKLGYPQPIKIGSLGDTEREEWVYVHETHEERQRRRREYSRTPPIRRGFRFQITFDQPVHGPICLGHSSHFGLGLFVPAEEAVNRQT